MTTTDTQKNTAISRSPIVAIMGHIDHGKTTLLDYIRKTAVAAKETGGITQHVAAYEVTHTTADGAQKNITFIDTPGHEAFCGIRNRGACVADIAVLIVSGEDGVKPQTLEALKFIKASNTPYIVAITKIDKPSASVERVKQSLLENEIYVEGYGGDVPCVPLSGTTGEGVDDLLEMILLVADVVQITGNPGKPAEGTVLEATRSKEKGVTATLIVQDGTLKKSMYVVAGKALSVLRTMEDSLGCRIDSATLSDPVCVAGWSELPKAGIPFYSFENKKEAEAFIANGSEMALEEKKVAQAPGQRVTVPVVVKADVGGTLEAVLYELGKLATDTVCIKVIQSGTGNINESDIKIATGGDGAMVIGFNVKVDNIAQALAERDGITVELFTIIYKLAERMQEVVIERTPKVTTTEVHGSAKIIRFFSAVKDKQVIGGKVLDGSIQVGNEFKIMRRGAEVGTGKIRELQQQKVKTNEVEKDREFGALAEARIQIAPGDVLDMFVLVTK
ncbi:MAG: translation initiation factor IF-2 [Candidatus Taylorbacteria bacterium]|nr:translation initiation factor IF-2 [Candidatus Taylorbacteria bacterium]